MLAPDRIQRLYEMLWPSTAPGALRVFAVLDGARDTKVFGAVDSSRQDKTCLYSVNAKWYLTDLKWDVIGISPYLLELDYEDSFTKTLLRDAWDNNWGVFIRTSGSIDKIRRHLRLYLNIFTESGKMLMFRYYDPRVLRVYLPTCTNEDLHNFFGPISAFILPARDPATAICYSVPGKELRTDTRRLDVDSEPMRELTAPMDMQPPGPRMRATLRSAQLQAIRTARQQDFEDRMLDHLNQFFPRQCQTSGEPKIRALIREGIARAGKYSFRSEREICRFVDLMIVFGSRFDQDASWAEAIFSRPGPDQLDQLLSAAQAHLTAIA